MRTADRLKKVAEAPSARRERRRFIRSLKETAARSVVTATVTFAVGFVLKKMFERSVAEAAEQGAKAGVDQKSADQSKRLRKTTRPKGPTPPVS
jgi:uncharacterized protein (DUF697 family)